MIRDVELFLLYLYSTGVQNGIKGPYGAKCAQFGPDHFDHCLPNCATEVLLPVSRPNSNLDDDFLLTASSFNYINYSL